MSAPSETPWAAGRRRANLWYWDTRPRPLTPEERGPMIVLGAVLVLGVVALLFAIVTAWAPHGPHPLLDELRVAVGRAIYWLRELLS